MFVTVFIRMLTPSQDTRRHVNQTLILRARARVCVCVCVCMRACMHVCVCACACVWFLSFHNLLHPLCFVCFFVWLFGFAFSSCLYACFGIK